jgi:hypothetical protein
VMLGNISDFNFSQLTGKTKLGAIGWRVEKSDYAPSLVVLREGTNPNQLVVYLHSKGFFHPQTGLLPDFGALSQDCMRMPKQCNVCSTQMTRAPHTPENMWAACCGCIAKLIDPYRSQRLQRGRWTAM